MPSCSTTNSKSKPTSGLNSFKSKYQTRICSTSVSAFQTRATGALKVRSITTASAKVFFVVMIFPFRLLRFCVRLNNSKHVTGWIFWEGKPANFRDRHFRHADFSAALLDFLDRLIQRFHRNRVYRSGTLSFARPRHSAIDSPLLGAPGRGEPVFDRAAFEFLELPANYLRVKRLHRRGIVCVNFKMCDSIHMS